MPTNRDACQDMLDAIVEFIDTFKDIMGDWETAAKSFKETLSGDDLAEEQYAKTMNAVGSVRVYVTKSLKTAVDSFVEAANSVGFSSDVFADEIEVFVYKKHEEPQSIDNRILTAAADAAWKKFWESFQSTRTRAKEAGEVLYQVYQQKLSSMGGKGTDFVDELGKAISSVCNELEQFKDANP